ncbi:MAG: FKBP-type peptidyl-prolyl cis-trans isomerase [Saprospiraceae bacterium]|nr:FKBP-type peptidyl-prolyl cis-trans isomerase [Saprospiraceae bacterium]
MYSNLILSVFCLSLFFVSCTKQEVKDEELIQAYIAEQGLNAVDLGDGLYYVETTEGVGPNPTITSTVTVHYRGYLLDGTEFDGSYGGNPVSFPLTNVILGWQRGIPALKEGGKGTLIIPSGMAYGANPPSPSIPRNAILVFDVELFEVN